MVIYPWCANYGGGRGRRRPELRVHIAAAVRVDPKREWRLLHSKPVVSALPAAADVFAALTAVIDLLRLTHPSPPEG